MVKLFTLGEPKERVAAALEFLKSQENILISCPKYSYVSNACQMLCPKSTYGVPHLPTSSMVFQVLTAESLLQYVECLLLLEVTQGWSLGLSTQEPRTDCPEPCTAPGWAIIEEGPKCVQGQRT